MWLLFGLCIDTKIINNDGSAPTEEMEGAGQDGAAPPPPIR